MTASRRACSDSRRRLDVSQPSGCDVALFAPEELFALGGGLGDLMIRISSRASRSSSDDCGGRELLRGGVMGGEDIMGVENQNEVIERQVVLARKSKKKRME